VIHVRLGRGQASAQSSQAWHRFHGRREDFRGVTFTAQDDSAAYGEQRFLTLGLLEDQVVSVAHTEQGEEIRIISIRKATKHEARFYFSQITY
jgi:uncharacterized DUF497 family protein